MSPRASSGEPEGTRGTGQQATQELQQRSREMQGMGKVRRATWRARASCPVLLVGQASSSCLIPFRSPPVARTGADIVRGFSALVA